LKVSERFDLRVNEPVSQDTYVDLSRIGLTLEERKWLERKCPFFQSDYLCYLQSFRFNPSQILIQFTPTKDDPEIGQIDIEADGLWVETILWEVPLMALLSEAYFKYVDTNWESDGQEGERIYSPSSPCGINVAQ
jgi:nicotinate phosphoribosyltransferase